MIRIPLNASESNSFDKAKQKILTLLRNLSAKTVSLVSMSSDMTYEEILELGTALRQDADISAALSEAGVIGHLDYGHNRYAQGPISLKFRITQSKTGKSGWSSWS